MKNIWILGIVLVGLVAPSVVLGTTAININSMMNDNIMGHNTCEDKMRECSQMNTNCQEHIDSNKDNLCDFCKMEISNCKQ